MSQNTDGPRSVTVLVVLAVFSAAALLGLAGAVRVDAAAARRLALFEAATTTQASNTTLGAANLDADASAARRRLDELEAKLPLSVEDVLQPLLDAAGQVGLRDVRLSVTGAGTVTGTSNALIAHGRTLAASGSEQAVIRFFDALSGDANAAVVLEKLVLTPAGSEWNMTADIVIYAWGGEE